MSEQQLKGGECDNSSRSSSEQVSDATAIEATDTLLMQDLENNRKQDEYGSHACTVLVLLPTSLYCHPMPKLPPDLERTQNKTSIAPYIYRGETVSIKPISLHNQQTSLLHTV